MNALINARANLNALDLNGCTALVIGKLVFCLNCDLIHGGFIKRLVIINSQH